MDQRDSIDRWELVETIFSQTKEANTAFIRVSLEITRPIFVDGRAGYPRMYLSVGRNDHIFRFQCPEGNFSEMLALKELLGEIDTEMLVEARKKLDILEEEERSRRRVFYQDRGDRRDRDIWDRKESWNEGSRSEFFQPKWSETFSDIASSEPSRDKRRRSFRRKSCTCEE